VIVQLPGFFRRFFRSFKETFGIDVDCYVLDDPQKTALSASAGWVKHSDYLAPATLLRVPFHEGDVEYRRSGIDREIRKSVKFQYGTAEQKHLLRLFMGTMRLLIDVSNAIIAAESDGVLPERYAKVAKQAHIILGASAKNGIKQLVYALAGYNPAPKKSYPHSSCTFRKKRVNMARISSEL